MLINNKRMQIMESGLNALSARQSTILHNLSNLETPNYKSKDIVFEDIYKNARGRYEVRTKTVTETGTNVRPDGNNVDADAENMKLYENYVQSLYLYSKISSDINNYRYVLKSAPK